MGKNLNKGKIFFILFIKYLCTCTIPSKILQENCNLVITTPNTIETALLSQLSYQSTE